jgi:hypothetical protein
VKAGPSRLEELGEGPCLQAHASGIPVLLPDLTAENANLWVPKSCAAWADVLQYAGGSVGRLVSARPVGGGMIFGLWA